MSKGKNNPFKKNPNPKIEEAIKTPITPEEEPKRDLSGEEKEVFWGNSKFPNYAGEENSDTKKSPYQNYTGAINKNHISKPENPRYLPTQKRSDLIEDHVPKATESSHKKGFFEDDAEIVEGQKKDLALLLAQHEGADITDVRSINSGLERKETREDWESIESDTQDGKKIPSESSSLLNSRLSDSANNLDILKSQYSDQSGTSNGIPTGSQNSSLTHNENLDDSGLTKSQIEGTIQLAQQLAKIKLNNNPENKDRPPSSSPSNINPNPSKKKSPPNLNPRSSTEQLRDFQDQSSQGNRE